MRFCKTTPCIKKSPLFFKDMTLRTFGPSEPLQSAESGPRRRDSGAERRPSRGPSGRGQGVRAGDLRFDRDEAAVAGGDQARLHDLHDVGGKRAGAAGLAALGGGRDQLGDGARGGWPGCARPAPSWRHRTAGRRYRSRCSRSRRAAKAVASGCRVLKRHRATSRYCRPRHPLLTEPTSQLSDRCNSVIISSGQLASYLGRSSRICSHSAFEATQM